VEHCGRSAQRGEGAEDAMDAMDKGELYVVVEEE